MLKLIALLLITLFSHLFSDPPAEPPYLWQANALISTIRPTELKDPNGNSWFGVAESVASSSSGYIYVVGSSSIDPSKDISPINPYLWTNSSGHNLTKGIELKDSNGSSLVNSTATKVIIYTPSITALTRNGNFRYLKGTQPNVSSQPQLCITGGSGADLK